MVPMEPRTITWKLWAQGDVSDGGPTIQLTTINNLTQKKICTTN